MLRVLRGLPAGAAPSGCPPLGNEGLSELWLHHKSPGSLPLQGKNGCHAAARGNDGMTAHKVTQGALGVPRAELALGMLPLRGWHLKNLLRGWDANEAFHPPPAPGPLLVAPQCHAARKGGGRGEVTSQGTFGLGCFTSSCPALLQDGDLLTALSERSQQLGAPGLGAAAVPGAEVTPAARRAPPRSSSIRRCRWAKLPPGEQICPQLGLVLLPRQLPSLSWHSPAEGNVCASRDAELQLSGREERAGRARAEVVPGDLGSLREEQASRSGAFSA